MLKLLKGLDEIAGIAEAQHIADQVDRLVRGLKELFGPFNLQARSEGGEVLPGLPGEDPAEIAGADVTLSGQVSQGEIFVFMPVEVIKGRLQQRISGAVLHGAQLFDGMLDQRVGQLVLNGLEAADSRHGRGSIIISRALRRFGEQCFLYSWMVAFLVIASSTI